MLFIFRRTRSQNLGFLVWLGFGWAVVGFFRCFGSFGSLSLGDALGQDCKQQVVSTPSVRRHATVTATSQRISAEAATKRLHTVTITTGTTQPFQFYFRAAAQGKTSLATIFARSEKQVQNDNRDSDDRLRDLPEWLEKFTDNLEDTEVLAPAHISQDSDSERPAKVASKSRRHSICIHFPKNRNCDICLRIKIAIAPCRRRTGEAVPRAKKLVT